MRAKSSNDRSSVKRSSWLCRSTWRCERHVSRLCVSRSNCRESMTEFLSRRQWGNAHVPADATRCVILSLLLTLHLSLSRGVVPAYTDGWHQPGCVQLRTTTAVGGESDRLVAGTDCSLSAFSIAQT